MRLSLHGDQNGIPGFQITKFADGRAYENTVVLVLSTGSNGLTTKKCPHNTMYVTEFPTCHLLQAYAPASRGKTLPEFCDEHYTRHSTARMCSYLIAYVLHKKSAYISMDMHHNAYIYWCSDMYISMKCILTHVYAFDTTWVSYQKIKPD